MRKCCVYIMIIIMSICNFGCSKTKTDDIVGSWYCKDNNILLTFYEDNTLRRDLLDYSSRYDGLYHWNFNKDGAKIRIDNEKNIPINNSEKDKLKIETNVYVKTDSEKISSNDASEKFFSRFPKCVITVLIHENASEKDIIELEKEIAAYEEVESAKYITAEEAWEEFFEEYFEEREDEYADGFKNDNPLLSNAAYIEITLKRFYDAEKMIAQFQTFPLVRKINKTCATYTEETIF